MSQVFNSLNKLGLYNSYYQPNLDNLIMAYVGLLDDANQTFDFYYTVVENHSKLINETNESVIEQALEVYIALSAEVKRREFIVEHKA